MSYEERYDRNDREDRDERPARRDERERVKKRQKPVMYKYRLQNSPKKPEVHGVQHPKLGEIISTKDGPCKVLEVFWHTATDADVLLRRVESEEKKVAAPKDAKKNAKTAKPAAKKTAPKTPKAPTTK